MTLTVDTLETGDWPIFQINGKSKERLIKALSLAPGGPAIGYALDIREDDNERVHRMVLFQYPHDKMTKFPGKATPDFLAVFIEMWMKDLEANRNLPGSPDIDGSTRQGWKIYTEDWGHIEPYGHPAYLAIEPHWIMYGK
jgi:hypothetical protein